MFREMRRKKQQLAPERVEEILETLRSIRALEE